MTNNRGDREEEIARYDVRELGVLDLALFRCLGQSVQFLTGEPVGVSDYQCDGPLRDVNTLHLT